MDFLFTLHSHTRWLILLVAVAAIDKLAIGWQRGSAFKGMDRGLAAGFSGLMDLQATLGLIFLIWTSIAGVPFAPTVSNTSPPCLSPQRWRICLPCGKNQPITSASATHYFVSSVRWRWFSWGYGACAAVGLGKLKKGTASHMRGCFV